jgi:metal-responsive CopG/Arc/MetJ family transcriptional regulator
MLCLQCAMVRTQIQLTEELARKLRRAARAQGVSMAEMVRRCLERGLEEQTSDRSAQYARAMALVGAFRDHEDASTVSVDHDEFLDEAFD